MVTPPDMTDRDAARQVLFRLRLTHPEITIVWADSAYAGQHMTSAKTCLNLTMKTCLNVTIRPSAAQRTSPGSSCCPGAEASNAHTPGACTRHARAYERLAQHSESLITWAAITPMTRRITRRNSRRSGQPPSREAQRD